jgi:hypothetical protein
LSFLYALQNIPGLLAARENHHKEMYMKNKKPGLFVLGVLTVLLAGCFNAVTIVPPKQEDSALDPFTIDVVIGKNTEAARSVAGPDAARIKGDIRNIIQLIVVNDAGEIAAFDEIRRGGASETEALLSVDFLPLGQTYHFLLLMGHWERNYDAENDENYAYTAGPPTLLAVGLKDQLVTGSGKITITMRPIVVDAVFETADTEIPAGERRTAAAVSGGKPERVSLFPVNWGVTWTIKQGAFGNGLTDLIRAQKIPDPQAGDALLLLGRKTIIRGTGFDGDAVNDAALAGNVVTLPSIGAYTSGITRIGKTGSVNFALEYVPFNLTASGAWNRIDKSVFDVGAGGPVWIIRNGVNDKAQNGDTDFNNLGNGAANGNGAVSFVITAKTPANGGSLVLKDGAFEGPAGSTAPYIRFTAEGYAGDAEAYYAVVNAGAGAPDYSAYDKTLGSFIAGTHREQVQVSAANGDYDIYVILMKGGEISDPVIINTARGGGDADWIWGDTPYMSLYVKSDGSDDNTGDKAHPLATLEKAVENIAAAYALDSWPNKGDSDELSAAVVILDTVAVTRPVSIDGSVTPPIILSGDPETAGGTLQTTAWMQADDASDRLLYVHSGADVTLDGGLILAGTGVIINGIRGVWGSGSAFTINSGKILDSSAAGSVTNGGGVYCYNSTFTMNGGEISGNSAAGSVTSGGGVYCYNSIFTMSGGEISGNSVTGSVSGGGGVFIDGSGVFEKTGGIIYGYDQDNENVSNAVRGVENEIINEKSHAVYCNDSIYKDTTAGPEDDLFFN